MKKAVIVLLAAFTTTGFASKNEAINSTENNTYVLVHGAWQAPYVWDEVRNDLIKKGKKVVVVELPGHGSDKTLTHTLNLDIYSNKVIEAVSKVDGKVILVGHSMAGMVISNAAEKIPAKISKLVYIGAFLPKDGQALTDLAYSDPDSKLGPNLVPSADQLTLDVKQQELVDLFIKDGSQADKDLVQKNYRAEPAIPFTNKVTLTKSNFGSVEKIYVKTLQDLVISPGLQDRMIADAGIKTVYSLNTGHSPFLSRPQEVSRLLLKIN
ncbi:MAG: alpha/beta fold hydrolase [Flavobacterium sp.]